MSCTHQSSTLSIRIGRNKKNKNKNTKSQRIGQKATTKQNNRKTRPKDRRNPHTKSESLVSAFSKPRIQLRVPFLPSGCGSKLNNWGKPQVLVHVSTYQGKPFWNSGFLSQPSARFEIGGPFIEAISLALAYTHHPTKAKSWGQSGGRLGRLARRGGFSSFIYIYICIYTQKQQGFPR